MKFFLICLFVFPLALLADDDEPAKAEVAASPTVETVVVKKREFHPEIEMLGLAASPANATLAVTVPAEVKIKALLVHAGQSVKAGEPLLEIEPPLDFQLAQSAASVAAKTLESAQKRYDLKLISIADLLAVQQSSEEARLRLEHFRSSGLSADGQQLQAPAGGSVEQLPAAPGDTVAAAAPLVEMIVSDALEVRGGLPPEAPVEVGQEAKISTVSRSEALVLAGKVQSVSRALNAETHLLDVTISLPDPAGLHPGESLRVRLPGPARVAVLVPKTALRSEEGETLVFTVKEGHAVRHEVETGSPDGDDVETISGGIEDGDVVVTTGNSQLADGMAVEIKGAPPAEESK